MPLHLSDVDLSLYIPRIAEQMTINQVKKFARVKNIPEVKIDEIKNNNVQDTAEQKVQLLQWWYQSHGRRDAYPALIKGLREASCFNVADRIQAMVQQDPENSASDGRNENETQNLE